MRILFLIFIFIVTLYASPETAQELGYHSDYNKAMSIAKKRAQTFDAGCSDLVLSMVPQV